MDKNILQDDLLFEAELFGVLAAFYNSNPDDKFIKAMGSLKVDNIDDTELKSALEKITRYAENCDRDEKILDVKRDWTKLFRGVSLNYGPQPPFEEVYINKGGTDPKYLSDIAKLYADNGYSTFMDNNSRPDYIGTQFDFLSNLALLKIHALKNNDEKKIKELEKVSKEFIKQHMRNYFRKFKDAATPYAVTDFYKGVLELTDNIIYAN